MFAKTIIDSDLFLDMPVTSRLLYYDLAMRADDDGFVNSPKKIIRMVGASQDDLKVLIAKRFIIPFENGVVVIRHWRIHNYIRKDTYTETTYQEEKNQLKLSENKAYEIDRPRPVDEPSTQVNKISIDKYSLDKYIYGQTPVIEPEVLTDKESWFNEFWSLYPKKVKKQDAVKAFNKVCKSQRDFDEIMAGLKRFLPTWKDPQFIPHPTSWLNQKRWTDEDVGNGEWSFDDL